MENIIPVDCGAEAFLELLNINGVEHIFLNPGTDTYPVQEAVCKYKTLGKRTPEVILSLHESVAMAAAHGYFMVTGKPQVVFVHADLGPQQVGGALHNAQRGRIGVVLCAGRVPSNTEEGRRNQVHWLQEQLDQPGVVRGYVKWEYELRSNHNIHQVVQRAFQVASSEPCGPVFLILPQDMLEEKLTGVRIPPVNQRTPVSVSGADAVLLDEIASILIMAEDPLIITNYAGRHTQSVASLIELAEILGARVIASPARMNFPTTHPLFSGFEAVTHLANADVILVIDHDVPYVPAQIKPKPEARIIHIDIDALKDNMPIWGFPTDILVQADSSKVLPALSQAIRQILNHELGDHIQARRKKVQSGHQQMMEKWQNLATTKATQKPISPDWLCHCLDEVIDENTIILEEAVTSRASVLRQIHRTQPGTFFQSGGSNLGWGLGAALGTKLASPDKTVVSVVGDGSFIFGCPTAALWAASTYKAPFLCVILNNMQYSAPKLVLRQALGPSCYSEKTGKWEGTNIKPSPDYAAVARACSAYGQIVEDPADLKSAFQTALYQVGSGKPAVLDIRIEAI